MALNPEIQAYLAGGIIFPATATVWTRGYKVETYAAGHPRPVNHTFHALVKLQGAGYGPKKRFVLERGDVVAVNIEMTVTAPSNLALVRGRIECRI